MASNENMHNSVRKVDVDSNHDDQVDKAPKSVPQASWYQRFCSFLGFNKRYNLPLYIIFAGGMLGFSLARLSFLDIQNGYAKSTLPGEWYWNRLGHYRVGITMHLGCILPAGVLMVWQFVPTIRRKFILFHRVNGYIVIALMLVSNIGALMIVRRSFGGLVASQAAVGVLVIYTTISIVLAYINIKRLQIEQHRAWMLRCMFAMGTIITTRIIMVVSARILTIIGSYYTTVSCSELNFFYKDSDDQWLPRYPGCVNEVFSTTAPPNTTSTEVAVHASMSSGNVEEIAASLRIGFSMALWLAMVLHGAGVEIYLRMTPGETARIREVSRQKQMAAGYKNPGSAGLVVEKFGDV